MNGFIVIAIVGVVVLAAVALLGAARRRDTGDAVGSLANETLKRDRQARKVADAEACAATEQGVRHETRMDPLAVEQCIAAARR